MEINQILKLKLKLGEWYIINYDSGIFKVKYESVIRRIRYIDYASKDLQFYDDWSNIDFRLIKSIKPLKE